MDRTEIGKITIGKIFATHSERGKKLMKFMKVIPLCKFIRVLYQN